MDLHTQLQSIPTPESKPDKLTDIAAKLAKHLSNGLEKNPKKSSESTAALNDRDILNSLQNLQQRINTEPASPYSFEHEKFLKEASELGITILDSIPPGAIHDIQGTVLILNDIGENSQLMIRNGGAIILGNVKSGVVIDVKDHSPSNSALSSNRYGITVVGFTGNHTRMVSSNNIVLHDCGDFVQLRASYAIKTGMIGMGANLFAKDLIETLDIGDDLRSVHFTHKFFAGNIGNRAIVKAGSIHAGDIGNGAEIVASYDCEAKHIGNSSSITARNIFIESSGMDCQIFAALAQNKISSLSG